MWFWVGNVITRIENQPLNLQEDFSLEALEVSKLLFRQ